MSVKDRVINRDKIKHFRTFDEIDSLDKIERYVKITKDSRTATRIIFVICIAFCGVLNWLTPGWWDWISYGLAFALFYGLGRTEKDCDIRFYNLFQRQEIILEKQQTKDV